MGMRYWFCLALTLTACGLTHAADISGTVQVMKKGGKSTLSDFANAVVYIAGVKVTAPTATLTMAQRDKTFLPRLLPLVQGQSVDFLNEDEVQHSVFSTDAQFDLGRYGKGQHKTIVFNQLGQFKVYCNIHQNMISDILVLENPYFSLTDAQGHYRITQVPAGQYTLKAWHIYGGEASQPLTVTAADLQQDFTLVSKKVVREITQHHNKDGQSYPSGYAPDEAHY